MNFNSIVTATGNNIVPLLRYIYKIGTRHTKTQILQYERQLKRMKKGENDLWLEHPETLLKHTDINALEVYLHLSSFRNKAEISITGENCIPNYVAEQFYNITQLKRNVLLTVTDTNVYFNT